MIERIDLARVRLALSGRAADSAVHLDEAKRYAAVAAILRDAEHGAEVLLIRRAAREGDPWSGHMAFPGGQREPEDRDLLDTAIRETREEIGLDLRTHARPLGGLETLPAVARGKRIPMSVTPFVFELCSEPPLTFSDEVAEVIWAPLPALARGELSTTIPYHFEGRELRLPAWDVQGRIVWGMTYKMLETLLALAQPAPASK